MSKALSLDLRARVFRAVVEDGLSCREAVARFSVSPSSAIRWCSALRTRGTYAPRASGGDRLSHRTEQHAAAIDALLEARADIMLRELKAELAQRDVAVSVSALWRYFRRHQITHKKRPVTRPNRIAPTS